MNIQKEIEEILSIDSINPKSITKQAKEYKENLEKKNHILNVINIFNTIDKLEKNKVFKKYSIHYIKFKLNKPFDCYDKHRNFLWDAVDKDIKKLNESLKDLFNNSLSEKYLGGNMDNFVDLSKPIKEQIYKILLSKELKQIMEYNEMQIELPHNASEEVKKIKL
jgi:hypothetical protein